MAVGIKGKTGVQAGLLLRVITPNNEVRLRCELGSGREKESRLLADAVPESRPGQVYLAVGRVEKLYPVRIGVFVFPPQFL